MFFQKFINLSLFFIDLYSSSTFQLQTIEYSKASLDALIIFKDTRTNSYLSKSLEWLFNNKILLSKFSGKDASLIGYAYGRLEALKENEIN